MVDVSTNYCNKKCFKGELQEWIEVRLSLLAIATIFIHFLIRTFMIKPKDFKSKSILGKNL